MPLPLAIVALKISASSGFAMCVGDFFLQVVRKKAIKKREERLPISSKEMIKAFAVGTVLGNLIGVPVYCKYVAKHIKPIIIPTILWTEAVWLPLHLSILGGASQHIESRLPSYFGRTAFTVAGGYLVCDIIIKTTMMGPASLTQVSYVARVIRDVGSTLVATSLFVFANKFADYQRNKTVVNNCPTVDHIQTLSTTVGQGFANFVAITLACTPWLPAHVTGSHLFYSGMLITPGFFYCTALNIEAGVKCEEILGRVPMDIDSKVAQQKRSSILQTLPLGALPAGLCRANQVAPFVIVGTNFMAAACASLYVAYQQEVWSKFREAEIDKFGKMADELDEEELKSFVSKAPSFDNE